MFLLNRRSALQLGGASLALGATGLPAAAALDSYSVHTASPKAGSVGSTIIMGAEKALIIDAQFIGPEAAAVAETIAGAGRSLETVFITHIHPDHHIGMGALLAKFPDARVVAHPSIAAALGQIGQGMYDGMKASMGDAVPAGWTAPEALEGALMLEGEQFEVWDPMPGDTPEITPVALPQFNALVAADIVYNGTHAWFAEATTPDALNAWRATLDTIEGAGFETIIPGHRTPDAVNDASGIAHMRTLMAAWESRLGEGLKGEDLKQAYLSDVGTLEGEFFLDRAVAAVGE